MYPTGFEPRTKLVEIWQICEMDLKAGKVSRPTSNSKRATFFVGGVGSGDGVGVEVDVDCLAWKSNYWPNTTQGMYDSGPM